jgi:stage II sporulation protein D
VVNRLPAEEYLRGVVPLELSGEGPADHAALEAQAVAARSYTYSRLASSCRARRRSRGHRHRSTCARP